MLTKEMLERRSNFFEDKYTTEYVYNKYPDASNVTYKTVPGSELGENTVGRYNPIKNQVLLHDKYLKKLSSREAADLLDTAFHEVGHSQNTLKAIGDALTFGSDGKADYFHKQIYDQATLDTADSIKGFLNERKGPCP